MEEHFGRTEPSSTFVFRRFLSHNSSPRTSTETTILEAIRAYYPSQLVTLTSPQVVDLHGYAKAGLAVLDPTSKILYDTTRLYIAPENRLCNLPGTLKDHVRFAVFTYVFKDHSFIVYEVEYAESQMFRPVVKLFYIISPITPELATESTPMIDTLLLTIGSWSSNLHKEIFVYDSGHWVKNKSLYNSVQSSTFDSVILAPALKKSLVSDVLTFFSSRSTYTRLSVPWKRGLLFHGLPGNGKTISIRAIINTLSELDEPVPSLVVKNFDHMQGPKFSIKEIFVKARSMSPCLLVFEDLDSLITNKTRAYFLNEVDGLECNDGILMIGTTNHLDSLDPAISKRPSRFDRKYHFKLPDEVERASYCEFWRKKLTGADADEHVVFDEEMSGIVAKLTEGFSFAYMKELFIISLLIIARGGEIEEIVDDAGATLESPISVAQTSSAAVSIESEGIHANTVVASASVSSNDDSEPIMIENPASSTARTAVDSITNIAKCSSCCHPCKQSTKSTQPAIPQAQNPKAPKPKRTLPDIAIPEHLSNNLLLKVLKAQCKALLEEMDNTDEDEWAGSSSRAGKRRGGPEGFRFPFMFDLAGDDDDGCC